MLIALMCAVIATLGLWPDTPAGRFLRRWVIEAPARRLTPGVMIAGLVLLLVVAGALAFGRDEGLVVVAQASEGIGWFVTFDVATYIDVLAVAWLLAATVRLRAIYAAVKVGIADSLRWARRTGARARGGRNGRRPGRRRPPSRDDGPGWAGVAFA